ncbi:MAG: response regulator [Chitinophagales bacterium]|nr:response regulator [Chitinophagales bacterium]
MSLSRILLAEDDLLDAELTIQTLRNIPLSNEILHFENGQLLLDYLYGHGDYDGKPAHDPAMIILDLKMPKVDGLEVLRQLKEDKTKKHIPIVMLTSSKEIKDVIESYGYGANSYIVKPVDIKQFEEVVSTMGLYWAVVNHLPRR